MISPDELEEIVGRLLLEGVPTGIVARVFHLDPELVREAQRSVRVKTYGTDDIAEYTEQLQWDAVNHAREIVASGSEADRMKFLSVILGKQVALNARRTPDAQRKSQEALLDLLAKQREGGSQRDSSESSFVVKVGGDA